MTFDYKPHGLYDPPVDPKRCKSSVSGDRARIWQCHKRRGEDGYCTIHGKQGQEARAKKGAERSRKWDLEFDLVEARREVIAAACRLEIFTDGPESRRLQKAVEKLKRLEKEL